MNRQLWLVADVKSSDGLTWEFLGVFDSEYLADQACTAHNHGFWPVILNQRSPDATTLAPNMRYPRAEK